MLVALGIPVAALSFSQGSVALMVSYNVLLFGMALVTWRLATPLSGLKVTRVFDPVLSSRVSNKIRVLLHNDGAEAILGVFRDEPPPFFAVSGQEFEVELQSGRTKEVTYNLTPNRRGGDYFRGSFFRLLCPLGLVQRIVPLRTEQLFRVYPNVLAIKEFDLLKQKGALKEIGIRKSRIRGLGTDFESLRDYSDGDDYRKIDWKATARKGKLVVRQFEQERNQAVVICVDVGKKMLSEIDGVPKLDLVLDAVLMLTHSVAVSGDLVGLLIYSDRVHRYIPPRKGRNQSGVIIDALYDLVAEPKESDTIGAFAYLGSRWKKRSLIITFTDAEDGLQGKEIVSAMGASARRHLSLCVRVADPKVKEVAESTVTSSDSLYAKAAALFVNDERRAADAAFKAAGLHSLETEPQELASALVSFYFTVKERSLL